MPRCFGRMTISGTGILRIVNRFLASLVRLSILSTFRAGGSDLDRFALEIVPRSSRKSIPTSILIAERLDFRPSTRPIPFYSSRSTFAPFQLPVHSKKRKSKQKRNSSCIEDGRKFKLVSKRASIFFRLDTEEGGRGGKGARSAGIVVGKAWMRSNEGMHEFNPPSSQEWSSSRVPKLVRLILDSLRPFLPPSLSLHTRAHTLFESSNDRGGSSRESVETSNVLHPRASALSWQIPAIFRKAYLQIDPWPDSKYVETKRAARFASVIIAVLVTARVSLSRPPSARLIGRDTLEGCRATRIRDKPTPDPINFGQRAPTDFSNSSPRRIAASFLSSKMRKKGRKEGRNARSVETGEGGK